MFAGVKCGTSCTMYYPRHPVTPDEDRCEWTPEFTSPEASLAFRGSKHRSSPSKVCWWFWMSRKIDSCKMYFLLNMVILSMNCCVILPEGFFQVGGNLTWKWSEIAYLFGNIWTSFNLLSLSSSIPENPKQMMSQTSAVVLPRKYHSPPTKWSHWQHPKMNAIRPTVVGRLLPFLATLCTVLARSSTHLKFNRNSNPVPPSNRVAKLHFGSAFRQ